MSEKIQANSPIFNVATIKSVRATLAKGATAPSNDTVIPAGYPLVAKGDGKYEVFTAATLAAQITGTAGSALPKAIAILAEDIKVANTMPTNVKVVFAGEVYLEGVRAAGVTTSNVADYVLREAHGQIVFTSLNDKQIYDLV